MNKENQHYVPKAFLKNFCINGKEEIFRSRFIEFKRNWMKPISKHINSICYLEDFYDVSPEFAERNGISQDYIERNAFWYEKGFMNNLIKKIENESIQQEDTEKLPEFYLSMIARNPVFMNGFNPMQIETLLDENIIKLREESEWIKKMAKVTSDKELDEWLDCIRSKLLAEQTQKNMYSKSIYNQHNGQSEIYNEIKNKLKGYKVMIGRIKEDDNFFITSDSPGFSMCQNGNIYSLKFKGDAFHYMPISSKVVVALLHPVYGFNAPIFSVTDVPFDTIHFINKGTVQASQEYVFCEDEDYLHKTLTKGLTNNNK